MNPHRASGLENLGRTAYNLAMRFTVIDLNLAGRRARLAACLGCAIAAQVCVAAVGDDVSAGASQSSPTPTSQSLQIFQQRTADGRVVLTDRPVAGAVTQRTWTAPVEDAGAARQRREQARIEALAVSDRIQRRIDAEADRDHELTLARMRMAGEQARRDAEVARASAQDAGAFYAPTYFTGFAPRPVHRPPHHSRPKPPRGHQPVFGMLGAQRPDR